MNLTVTKAVLFSALAFATFPVFAQLSYQQATPLKFFQPEPETKAKTEQPAITPRPRFRGWKHTENDHQVFGGCGATCFPTNRVTPQGSRPFAQVPSTSLSGPFTGPALRPTLPAGAIPLL